MLAASSCPSQHPAVSAIRRRSTRELCTLVMIQPQAQGRTLFWHAKEVFLAVEGVEQRVQPRCDVPPALHASDGRQGMTLCRCCRSNNLPLAGHS